MISAFPIILSILTLVFLGLGIVPPRYTGNIYLCRGTRRSHMFGRDRDSLDSCANGSAVRDVAAIRSTSSLVLSVDPSSITIISYEQPTSLTASAMLSNVPIMFFSSFLHGTQIVRSSEFSSIGSTAVTSFGRGCSSDFIIVSCCSRDLHPEYCPIRAGNGARAN